MRVLVVYYRNKTTFIQRDIDILKKHFEVDEICIRGRKDIFPLFKMIKNSDVVFIWFAGKHAGASVFLSRLLRKKSIVVVGGYEVANVPEIGYGLWYSGKRIDKFLSKYAIENSDATISVSAFHQKEMLKLVKPKRNYLVYNGVPDNFCGNKKVSKKNQIITVSILKRENIQRKGLKMFLEIARAFPRYKFLIVGKPMDDASDLLRRIAPKNVEILGFVDNNKLSTLYAESRVYMQLSAYESFGIAVVEAMKCGCIPMVTNRGALPEVVGDAGIVVEYGNLDSIKEGIKMAMEWGKDETKIKKAIERAGEYNMSKRERKLIELINNLVT